MGDHMNNVNKYGEQQQADDKDGKEHGSTEDEDDGWGGTMMEKM